MAGESPDRSKQRESSARTTSGSADSVPESRKEAGDPRLALTGESDEAGASGASGGSEGRGGVDTATRVLSVRDVKTKPETDPKTESSSKTEPDVDDVDDAGDTEAAADGDETDGAGDTRLRAAVAEWVDSDADGKDAEAAEAEEDADDSDDADDPEPAKAGAGPESDAGEPEGAARGKDGAERRGADEAAADASDAEDADTSDGDDRDGDDGERADADAESEAETGTASEAPERARAVAEPEDGAEASEDGDGERAEDDASKAGDDDRDGDESDGDGRPSGDGKRAEGDKASEGDAGPGEKPPVDQPTTMLKLGGAAKPQVDQPTTMLKLGGAKKQAPEAEAERTSKFVALKPLDTPPARKPQLPKPPTPTPAPPQSPASAPKPAPAAPTAAAPQLGPERTTQQPLPPKPPLDLLAELTNTPPPPETPLRTTVRRVKIWTPLVILLLIVFAVAQSVRSLPETSLALTAEDTYTFDGDPVKLPWPDEGQGWMDVDGVGTMDHFGEQKPVPIGSVAKTMTAYIILREHPLKADEEGPKIEVDPTAEKEAGYSKDGESTLDNVKAGSFLTEKQALSAVMIPSANNIARLLARWDAGSEAEFVKKMNATAKELGMSNTTYTDPSGLNKTTVSTAEDQVKLGNAAMRIPAMVAITSAASWTDPSGKNWTNFNQLPYIIGAIGIKTGSTTAAGGNLLFAARKEVGGRTVTIVGAILGQHKPSILDTVNAVSKTALLAAKDVPTSAKILKRGDVVGYIDDQLGGHTPVVVTKDVTAVGWGGLRLKLSLTTKNALPHTAKAGTEVGMLAVGEGAESAVQVPVALQDDLAEPGFAAKLTRVG
ncbi:D-alanyl-D-alanine carboxypeptidase [Streptomyces sp. NPDC042207]|uniref:D-alanyl-D-alanine carboxypeptidase n=1 Tax=Streptomyces sp. NPDC042207 TaxID=3154331 RepID=UPI0033D33996